MKLIRNDGNGGRDNCTVQRNEKDGEAEREPMRGSINLLMDGRGSIMNGETNASRNSLTPPGYSIASFSRAPCCCSASVPCSAFDLSTPSCAGKVRDVPLDEDDSLISLVSFEKSWLSTLVAGMNCAPEVESSITPMPLSLLFSSLFLFLADLKKRLCGKEVDCGEFGEVDV